MEMALGHDLICLHWHLLWRPGSFQSLIDAIPPVTSAEPSVPRMVPGQLQSPSDASLLPVRGFPRSWGFLQLFLWPSQQLCGKYLDALPCQSQIIRNLLAVSGPLSGHNMSTLSILFYHTIRGTGSSVTCLSWSLSMKDRSSLPLNHTPSHSSPGKKCLLRGTQYHFQPFLFPLLCPCPQFTGAKKWDPRKLTHSPRPQSLLFPLTHVLIDSSICSFIK